MSARFWNINASLVWAAALGSRPSLTPDSPNDRYQRREVRLPGQLAEVREESATCGWPLPELASGSRCCTAARPLRAQSRECCEVNAWRLRKGPARFTNQICGLASECAK